MGSSDTSAVDGWHYGVVGMKVGSKRILICPPNAAYGINGLLPFVPANATIVFSIVLQKIQMK